MLDFKNAKLGPCLFVNPRPGMKVKVKIAQSCPTVWDPMD